MGYQRNFGRHAGRQKTAALPQILSSCANSPAAALRPCILEKHAVRNVSSCSSHLNGTRTNFRNQKNIALVSVA
jgi:hypothetical protein